MLYAHPARAIIALRHAFLGGASDHLSKRGGEKRRAREGRRPSSRYRRSLTCHLDVRRAPHLEIPRIFLLPFVATMESSTSARSVACPPFALVGSTRRRRRAARCEKAFASRGRVSRTGQPPRSFARCRSTPQSRTPRIESHVQSRQRLNVHRAPRSATTTVTRRATPRRTAPSRLRSLRTTATCVRRAIDAPGADRMGLTSAATFTRCQPRCPYNFFSKRGKM